LSDGYQAILVIVLDLSAPVRVPVLGRAIRLPEWRCWGIDEIDLHLHPAVAENRLAAVDGSVFPNTQFELTTHSPICGFRRPSIRVSVVLCGW